MNKNVITVIDGAAGSCGKAKVVGEIATDKNIKLGAAVTNCMPNAGHTFVDENGNATVFRNIPVSIVNPETELFIGPGSAIDMTVFQAEYKQAKKYLKDRKIYVHEMVPLIESRHKQYEKEHIKTGSTFKGGNTVTCEKIMKEKNLEFFQTYKNAVVCSNNEWHERLYQHLENPNEYVILEGAQGCDLDINHSGHYPNTTCREVSTMQLLADSGIAAERLLETIMVIRPFPIRISNITSSGEFIYSGNYGNGDELTWTEINIATLYGGYPHRSIIDCYNSFLKIKKIKKLLSHCPEIYLKQTFGENYKSIKIDEITLLEALELERLMYKARGIQEYQTRLIELPMFDKDFPPNTIIDQSEQTTVTKMERRIFNLDIKKLKLNCQINNPYVLYLNFFQHLGLEYKGEKGNFENYYFNRYLREYFDWLERNTQVEIAALGTGPKNMERILKKPLIK